MSAPSAPTVPPGLAVVVVNYGPPDLLASHLPPTLPHGATVVVVDNFSGFAARRAVVALAREHGWLTELSDRNVGFGAGADRGVARARAAGCDRFLLLNPDCSATPAVVAALDARVRASPTTAVAPRIVRPGREKAWFVGYTLDPHSGFSRRDPSLGADGGGWGWLTGAFVAVHRELWDRIGGFDPDYFLYWEDVDLSRRIVLSGGRLQVCVDLEAVHEVGGTQTGAGTAPTTKSSLYCYWNTRNRLLFAARHLPSRDQLRWLLRAPAAAWQVVLRSGPRAALRHPGLSVAAVRGTLSGATIVAKGLLRPWVQDRAKR